jgi:hypothetical protein
VWRLTEDEYKALQAKVQVDIRKPNNQHQPSVSTKSAGKVKAKSKRKEKSKASYRIIVISKRKRDLDPDNIFPKWIIDQLVKFGLLPDDSSKYVLSIEKRVERSTKEETIVEVWQEQKE